MSYNSKDFSVMAYANGFTLWSYRTKDMLGDLKEPGYFNETAPFVRAGDMIMVTANSQADIQSAILSVVEVKDQNVSVRQITN